MANQILKLDEESYKREEKDTFNGSESEVLKYIQTLICFTNYLGGEMIIKEVKDKNYLKSFFDSAVLEKKINSYIEPPISGTIAVNSYNKRRGVKIKIRKSGRTPHWWENGVWENGVWENGVNSIFNKKSKN